ncbi:MAG: radical SAM protein [Candidatus Nanoarchaeia archaeon]|nr:radical SAM protein [Candidatus Nanoarchaeia archaeon]
MKITFVIPPTKHGRAAERLFGCTFQVYAQPNLVVLYPATMLKKKHKVVVRDFPVEEYSYSEYKEWSKKDNSDIYCFHTVPLSRELDLSAVKALKKKPVIFFGPEPTDKPEIFLKEKNHYVIRGEVEASICSLVDAIENNKGFENVVGLSYIKDKKIIHNKNIGYIKDINTLPIPDRTLIKYKKYRNPKLPRSPFTTMLTSRACSYRCYYCVPCSLSYARELDWKSSKKGKPPVTLRSPENIYKELVEIKKLGIKAISVIDDQFVWNKERHHRICMAFKKVGLPFGILARCDRLTDEKVVKDLADAGCIYVDLGVESFNQEILNYCKKDLDVKTIKKSIDLLQKYGIEPKINILYGTSPLETKKTLRETLDKVKALDVDFAQFAVASPFPGTEFREIGLKEGWVVEPDVGKADPSKRSLVKYPHLPQKYLDMWVVNSFREFYFRPKIILKRLMKIRNFSEFKVYLKGLYRLTKRKDA